MLIEYCHYHVSGNHSIRKLVFSGGKFPQTFGDP